MAEKRNAIPRLRATFALDARRRRRKDHAVHGAAQQAVGPVAEQVADVDEDGRAGVGLCAGRAHGDGRPAVVAARVELEAGLAAQAEEECDAAVVGVRAGADVGLVGLQQRVGGECGQRRVVQKAQDVARGPVLAQVAVVEEVGRLDGEADAEEVIDFEGEKVAVIVCRWSVESVGKPWEGRGPTEGADLALVRSKAVWDRLLGFAVYEVAKIERSAEDRSWPSVDWDGIERVNKASLNMCLTLCNRQPAES